MPIWDKNREGVGLEHLLFREGSADSVVLALDEDGRPFRLAYQLAWDQSWRLREAQLVVTTERAVRSLRLETDGQGHWRDGEARALPELEGCLDVDIWPTPFTNTFPIRRHPLAVGERRYRFENLYGDGFHAELAVDEGDVVLDYERLFRRVA